MLLPWLAKQMCAHNNIIQQITIDSTSPLPIFLAVASHKKEKIRFFATRHKKPLAIFRVRKYPNFRLFRNLRFRQNFRKISNTRFKELESIISEFWFGKHSFKCPGCHQQFMKRNSGKKAMLARASTRVLRRYVLFFLNFGGVKVVKTP